MPVEYITRRGSTETLLLLFFFFFSSCFLVSRPSSELDEPGSQGEEIHEGGLAFDAIRRVEKGDEMYFIVVAALLLP